MATVFIWNNNIISAKFGRGHSVIGHASLNIVDEWVNFGVNNDHFYVSWWPGEGGGVAGDSFLEDIKDEEGYAPDHVIRIEKSQLDTMSMMSKWHEIRNKHGASYKFFKKNCSTIASRVLKAGSSSGSVLKRHHAIWTPLEVKRLAYAMGGKDMNWVEFVMELKGSISAESLEQLKTVKRRSSRHGDKFAAPSRFDHGVDTGKIDPDALFV